MQTLLTSLRLARRRALGGNPVFLLSGIVAATVAGALFAPAAGRAQGNNGSGYQGTYHGTMHSYCPSFDYTDALQITVAGDGTASAVVPARSSNYSSQGTVATDGTINGLSIRVTSLSRGQLTIPYTVNVRTGAFTFTGTGRSEDIQVDVDGLRTPAFFNGETSLSQGIYFLQLGNASFGYYAYLSDPHYVYHFDLGYEYWFDAGDAARGVYLYDFASGSFFYTSPSFPFPYLYDFSLNALLYYYPDSNNFGRYTQNPRYFFNFKTGQIITK